MNAVAQTYTARNGTSVASLLTQDEAVQLCWNSSSGFDRSIAQDAMNGVATMEQIAWLHIKANRLAKTRRDPAPRATARATVANFAPIAAMFERARAKVQWPKIIFDLSEDRLVLSLMGGQSKHAGSIRLTDGRPYGVGVYYGRIDPSGFVEFTDRCPAALRNFLVEFANDPERVAAEYGRNNGHCCFCDRELTDPKSLEVGYGPDCGKSYGLSHGRNGKRK